MSSTDSHRYRRGLEILQKVENTGTPSIVTSLKGLAPDLATLAVSFVYGEIYTRPHLGLPERQLITVAILAALGNAKPQLKFHVAGALNVGCARHEVVESMLHLAVYAGFPAALNGVFAVQEVFRDCGMPDSDAGAPQPAFVPGAGGRFDAGWSALRKVDGHAGEEIIAALADIAPDLGRFIIEFGFGDIYTRPGLGLLQRELITVAALAAMGTAAPQLRVHMHGLLNVGGNRDQLVETLIHVAAYAGFPAALNGMSIAGEILAERGMN